jgi:MATE family multidrug resistance protein
MSTEAPRSISRQLVALALPMMGGSLFQVAMLIADGIMCGHIADHGRSLTALGFAVQIVFLLLVPSSALGIGAVALMSRAHGANDHERMQRVFTQAVQVAIALGVVVGAAAFVFGDRFMGWLGASPDIAAIGSSYLQLLVLAFPIAYLTETLAGILRSLENTRLPFVCAVAGSVANFVLGYGLIFGHLGLPALGITGAGLATAIAETLALALLVIGVRRAAITGLALRLRGALIDRPIAAQIVRIALPSLFEQVTFYGTMTALIWILARIDETSVAAHSIGARAAALLMVPAFALSGASSAVVGNALGAGSVDNARETLRVSIRLVLAVMVPIAAAAFACTPWIAAAYDIAPHSALDDYMHDCFHLLSASIVLQGVMLMFEGLLFGAGASATVMKINLSVDLGLRVTLAAVLGLATPLGALGVWLSWPAALLVQLPLAWIAYRRGRWAVTGVGAET